MKTVKNKRALYLDDIRTPTDTLPGYEPWEIVRNYEEFTRWIMDNGLPDLVSFDHDLADEHMQDYYDQIAKIGWQSPSYNQYKERTGLDCAKFLCESFEFMISMDAPDSPHSEKFPTCVVHSHNPVGADNIKSYINGFIKHYKIDAVCYEQRFPFTMETIIKEN